MGYGTISLRSHFPTYRDNTVVTTSMVENFEKLRILRLHNYENIKPPHYIYYAAIFMYPVPLF